MNIVKTIINEIKEALKDHKVLHSVDTESYTIQTEDNIFVVSEEDNTIKIFDNIELCTINVRLLSEVAEDLFKAIKEATETNEEKLERLHEELEQVMDEKREIAIKINLTRELFNNLPDFSSANQEMFDNKMESFQVRNNELICRENELFELTRELENIILGE